MMKAYQGHYPFTKEVLSSWESNENGVYYIGVIDADGILVPHYVGKGAGAGGMRDRLIDHLGRWSDVTHFGYQSGTSVGEIDLHEIAQIKRFSPKENIQHV